MASHGPRRRRRARDRPLGAGRAGVSPPPADDPGKAAPDIPRHCAGYSLGWNTRAREPPVRILCHAAEGRREPFSASRLGPPSIAQVLGPSPRCSPLGTLAAAVDLAAARLAPRCSPLGTLAAAVDLAAARLAPVLAPARPPRPGARPGARLGGRRLDNAALAAYLTNAKQGRQRSFWGIVDSSTFTGNTLSPSDRAMRYRLMYCHSASIWMVSQYFGV